MCAPALRGVRLSGVWAPATPTCQNLLQSLGGAVKRLASGPPRRRARQVRAGPGGAERLRTAQLLQRFRVRRRGRVSESAGLQSGPCRPTEATL